MKDEAKQARHELEQFIEQELGWDVKTIRLDQNDRYGDEPIELDLEVRCQKEIKRSNEYRLK